ncbi:LEF-1 [Plodia interpunctella granulovirus]|uniref:LEF-1 n=1 Tax=Plodia interpunctella granulovirus TaxID=262175 RepID=A0A1L5JGP0_9BBAC|nr:LEF-1 [Plodia interpunctella granulovirus]APO13945.1 LEF-1 [Plodia interpunctella granulovirus]
MHYTREQLMKVWLGVKFRDDRSWAFVKRHGGWVHTDSPKSNMPSTFKSFDEFEAAVRSLDAVDMHVKAVVDGGREWIIDVDHDETDRRKIALKNMISHATFEAFFGPNIVRVMFSGNRGLHVWLDHEEFDYRAEKRVRTYYYDAVLAKPARLIAILAQPGSFNTCFLRAFENEWIQREIAALYPDIKPNDAQALLKEFFPNVDKQVFTTNKQIRAPYSFHSKGQKYNTDHVLLYK